METPDDNKFHGNALHAERDWRKRNVSLGSHWGVVRWWRRSRYWHGSDRDGASGVSAGALARLVVARRDRLHRHRTRGTSSAAVAWATKLLQRTWIVGCLKRLNRIRDEKRASGQERSPLRSHTHSAGFDCIRGNPFGLHWRKSPKPRSTG